LTSADLRTAAADRPYLQSTIHPDRGSPSLRSRARKVAKSFLSIHRPDGSPNIFLFSLPRSGSTWLMELVQTQPGFKTCDEPLDLRNPFVRAHSGLTEWVQLYRSADLPTIAAYFDGFCRGSLHFMDPNPVSRYYRPVTRRIVFKMIHGCEHRLRWFADNFNGRIIYLIRHPIAVAISRESYPTLLPMLRTEYADHFTARQLAAAEKVIRHGDKLECGVLSWCLQTSVPLRHRQDDWVVISYEQMVEEPQKIVEHVCSRLELPYPDRMLRWIDKPSHVKYKSDQATQQVLESRDAERRHWLVRKWREKVSPEDEMRVMSLLEEFELDAYSPGELMPDAHLMIS